MRYETPPPADSSLDFAGVRNTLAGERPQKNPASLKYDPATEAVFKGTVEDVSDHMCPLRGGMVFAPHSEVS
jgi:hypothetical protein